MERGKSLHRKRQRRLAPTEEEVLSGTRSPPGPLHSSPTACPLLDTASEEQQQEEEDDRLLARIRVGKALQHLFPRVFTAASVRCLADLGFPSSLRHPVPPIGLADVTAEECWPPALSLLTMLLLWATFAVAGQ